MSDGTIIINNPAYGIGDAVIFCWLLKTANAAGYRVRIIPRRNHEVFKLFGCEEFLLPDEDHPGMIVPWPPKGLIGGNHWVDHWLIGYGCGPCKTLVRPSPSHHARDLAEAEAMWIGRQKATGGGRRVLIFPDSLHAVRVWGESGFARLASVLESRGLATITMFQKYRPHKFPFAYGGLSLRLMAALIQRADLVVGCESGPVHFSTTMEKKTAIMYGPTRPELVHGHTLEYVIPFQGKGPCVGCNFQADRGYRKLCWGSCDTIKTIDPWHVAETLMTPEEQKNVTGYSVFNAQSRPLPGTMQAARMLEQMKQKPVEVTVGGGLDRGTSVASGFMEQMCDIIRSRCITRIVETGTYDGRGSTLHLANAIPREGGHLYTIECDKERAKMAEEFHRAHGNMQVEVQCGLSLPRVMLPTREKCRDAIQESKDLGYAVDGQFIESTVNFYFEETNKQDVPEDLLAMGLAVTNPELVFLDSAGYTGWEEWQIVRDWAAVHSGVLVGMDDVKHIKHWRSLKDAKERGWKVLLQDDARYGAVLLEAP